MGENALAAQSTFRSANSVRDLGIEHFDVLPYRAAERLNNSSGIVCAAVRHCQQSPGDALILVDAALHV